MTHSPVGAGKSSFDLIDADAFINAINLQPDMTVLDLACGAGNYTLAMAREMAGSGRIIAVDLWEEGIATLQQSARTLASASIETHVADIRLGLPVEDAVVDFCLMATVLHDFVHEGDPLPVLKEIARVLKPRGILAVAEFKKQEGPPGPPKAIRLRLEEVAALLLPIGFIRFSGVVELGPQIYFVQLRRL